MWRDEIQAWLLARESPWPWDIFHTIRYEGHPALWHLLLWLPSHLSSNPAWMQIIHVAIATFSAWMLWRHSPLPLWVSATLPFGYFMFYEYGVLSRNYAISVALLFILAHQFRLMWRASISLGFITALLCHSNVHSMILVLGSLPWVIPLYFWHRHKGIHEAKETSKSVLIGLAIALIGLGTAIIQIIPPTDTGFAEEWEFEWEEKRSQKISKSVVHAYAPVPVDRLHYWNSNTFFDHQSGLGWFDMDDAQSLALFAIILASLSLLKRPYLLLPYLSSSIGLWAFFYIKYPGAYRHHGFFALIWIVTLWISLIKHHDLSPQTWWKKLHSSYIYLLLLTWAALSCWGSWVAASREIRHPFSQGQAAGLYLLENFGREVIVTGNHGAPQMSTLVGYSQIPQYYHLGNQAWSSYVTWDQTWRKRPSYRQINQSLIKLSDDFQDKELVFVSSRNRYFQFKDFELKLLKEFTGSAVTYETYALFQVIRKK